MGSDIHWRSWNVSSKDNGVPTVLKKMVIIKMLIYTVYHGKTEKDIENIQEGFLER